MSFRNALKAQQMMNGRFYAGRMLNVEFCNIQWKSAVCGRLNNMQRVASFEYERCPNKTYEIFVSFLIQKIEIIQ